jgi:hypothetical protein
VKRKGLLVMGIVVVGIIVLACYYILLRSGGGFVMLDSFEGRLDHKTVDYGASDNSLLEVGASTDIKICGAQSLKLQYTLEAGGYMWCARGYGLDVLNAVWEKDFQKVSWDQYNAIGFQMFGNQTGTVAFDLKDAGGELHRYLVQDDFSGWKEIVIPFSKFKAREDWQPQSADGNKQLDFPVKSFQWEPKSVGQGVLYFDCVRLSHI